MEGINDKMSPGKRRAVSPAVSVMSQSLNSSNKYKARKRMKQEPDITTPWPTPSPANSQVPSSPALRNRIEEPYLEEDSTSPLAHGVQGQGLPPLSPPVPANLLNTLSTRSTATKKFQDGVRTVVAESFSRVPRSIDDAPGLLYLQEVADALKSTSVSINKVDDIKECLMEVWRHQMADYVGESIPNVEALRITLNAIVSASSFKPGHNDFVFQVPAQLLNEECSQESGKTQLPGSIGPEDVISKPSSLAHSCAGVEASSTRSPQATVRLFNASSTKACDEVCGLSRHKRGPETSKHDGVKDEPETGCSGNSANLSGSEPLMIPFTSGVQNVVQRSVMFVLNTPGKECSMSRRRLESACKLAFSDRPRSLERWSDHIWVATFSNPGLANKAKGKAIDLNGLGIFAEHLPQKPPMLFSCELTGVDVSTEEVALRVAQTFANHARKPKLEEQASEKLNMHRNFLLTVPQTEKLFRLYIPMRRADSKDFLFTACFRPVNVCGPCRFCNDKHGIKSCPQLSQTSAVPLPSVA